MEYYIKERNEESLLRGFWGKGKVNMYGFKSLKEMTENEVKMMKKARDLYEYIPEIIEYDSDNKRLIVTKVDGENIDKYIRRTKDLGIIDKLEEGFSKLQKKKIVIDNEQGYIMNYDYHPGNFMVDKNKNIWFVDWDISGLGQDHNLIDDKNDRNEFKEFLRTLV